MRSRSRRSADLRLAAGMPIQRPHEQQRQRHAQQEVERHGKAQRPRPGHVARQVAIQAQHKKNELHHPHDQTDREDGEMTDVKHLEPLPMSTHGSTKRKQGEMKHRETSRIESNQNSLRSDANCTACARVRTRSLR